MTPRIPQPHTAAYKLAQVIYNEGPQTEAEMFSKVAYDRKGAARRELIVMWVALDWLKSMGEKVGIGHAAIAHFDALAKEEKPEQATPKYVGQIAAPRDFGNVYERPPLSRRNIPDPRGFRIDIPDYSVRIGQSFRTVG